MIALLLILVFVYAIYALASNIVATSRYTPDEVAGDIDTTQSWVQYSIGTKEVDPRNEEVNGKMFVIQALLGLAVTIIWTISLFCMKYFEKAEEVRVEE